MVTANAERLAAQAEQTIDRRDFGGLAVLALGAAGGVVVSQMIADRVMEEIHEVTDPATATQWITAIGTKVVVALGSGYLAAQTSGLALVLLAFHGIGALASAGTDVLDWLLAQTGGDAAAPRGGRSQSTVKKRARSTASRSSSPSATSSGGTTTAASSV